MSTIRTRAFPRSPVSTWRFQMLESAKFSTTCRRTSPRARRLARRPSRVPASSSRCRTAAITAAPTALSGEPAAYPAVTRKRASSSGRARRSPRDMAKSCSPGLTWAPSDASGGRPWPRSRGDCSRRLRPPGYDSARSMRMTSRRNWSSWPAPRDFAVMFISPCNPAATRC